MNHFSKIILVLGALMCLQACHTVKGTVHGMGQDVQSVTGKSTTTTTTSTTKTVR